MKVTVNFPPGSSYIGTTEWFLDPSDAWTVDRLCQDICHDGHLTGHHLEVNGAALVATDLQLDALSEGDSIDVIPD